MGADHAAVSVNLGTGSASGGHAQGDTFSNFSGIIGSSWNDVLVGSNGSDTLWGADGIDSLSGGGGADRIVGGSGADSMTGGAGSDTFVFQFPNEGVDRITDWQSGTDRIEVSASGFGGGLVAGGAVSLSSAANFASVSGGANGYFIFDTTGTDAGLYWDQNGGNGSDAALLLKLAAGSIAASGILVV